jgi:hypothetical protein
VFVEQNFSRSVLTLYGGVRNFVCDNMQHLWPLLWCRWFLGLLACWLVDCAVVQTRMVNLTQSVCIPHAGLAEWYVTGLKIDCLYNKTFFKVYEVRLKIKFIRSKSVKVLTLNFGERVFAGVAV